jgi:hypothetical protein
MPLSVVIWSHSLQTFSQASVFLAGGGSGTRAPIMQASLIRLTRGSGIDGVLIWIEQ